MPLSLGTPRFMWPCSDHLEFFSFFPIFWAWDFPGLRARTFQAWWVAAVDKLRAHKYQLRAQRRFLRKCLKEEDGRMVSLTGPYCSLGHINQPLTQGSSGRHVPKRGPATLPLAGGFAACLKHFGAKLSRWKDFFFNFPNICYFY